MRVLSRTYLFLIDPWVRVIMSGAVGVLAYLLSPEQLHFEIRFLIGWDVGVLLLLLILQLMMIKTSPEETWKRSQQQEPSNTVVLAFSVVACGASLVAVALMINDGQHWKSFLANMHLALCMVAIFCAWLILHTYFALHYARMYYDEPDGKDGGEFLKGLEFPGSEVVDYWDFMYYSFTIGMCYQTSDVSVTSASVRRVTLIHSILSFGFVATIIGLVVNVISNLV